MRLEEAERKLRAAESQIAEKDQKITEVERLLGCMGKVKQRSGSTAETAPSHLIGTFTSDFLVFFF